MPTSRHVAAGLGVLFLTACSGVGEGNKPESLTILQVTPTTTVTKDLVAAPPDQAQVYTCIRSALGAYVTFTKGDIGNFTRRVRWSSDNEAVLRVSNADEPVPDTDTEQVFDYGSLTPVAPGTANVTATYLGMSATIPVVVSAVDTSTLKIVPDQVFMAPGSFQIFRATADLDGVTTDVSTVVNFRLAEENDEVATLDTVNNALLAVAAGAPLSVEARFNSPCSVTPAATATVAPLTGLQLDYEDGFDRNMLGGTSQFLTTTGLFGDVDGDGTDDTQDLSQQAVTSTTDADVVFTGGLLNGYNLLLVAEPADDVVPPVALGSAQITANFGATDDPDGDGPEVADPGVDSNALDFDVVATDPDSIAMEPADPVTIAPGENTQFKVKATYTFDGVTRTQDVTRHVIWTATDDDGDDTVAQAVVGTGVNSLAGLAVSATEDNSVVTITATYVLGVLDSSTSRPVDDPDDLVVTNTLNVVAPAP